MARKNLVFSKPWKEVSREELRSYKNKKRRESYYKNKELSLARSREWQKKTRQRILETHGAFCHICGSLSDLVIDHNHNTGLIRGILCRSCNTKLGWLEKRHYEIDVYRWGVFSNDEKYPF